VGDLSVRRARARAERTVDDPTSNAYSPNNSNGHDTGGKLGRYSRVELKPDQLLHQLGQPSAHTDQHSTILPPVPPELQDALDKFTKQTWSEDILGAWESFQQLAGMLPKQANHFQRRFSSLPMVTPAMQQFLYACTVKWLISVRSGNENTSTPSPYQVLLSYHNLYISKPQFYRPTLWRIASGLARRQFSKTEPPSHMLETGLKELLNIWRICIGGKLARSSFGPDINEDTRRAFAIVARNEKDWSFLPSIDVFKDWKEQFNSDDMYERLLEMIAPSSISNDRPPHTRDLIENDYAGPALITLDFLRTSSTSSESGEAPAHAPFVALQEALLQMTPSLRVPPSIVQELRNIKEPYFHEQYKAMLLRLKCNTTDPALSRLETQPTEASPTDEIKPEEASDAPSQPQHSWRQLRDEDDSKFKFSKPPASPEVRHLALQHIKRLGRAAEQADRNAVERYRRQVYKSADHAGQRGLLPIEVYEHLMLASLSVRDAPAAVETWQQMVKVGHTPTLRTYTAMLRGAQKSRDVQGLEVFWRKMREAGFKPDGHAWSIRIFGLIRLRNATTGLRALAEMSQEWFAAAKAKVAPAHAVRRGRHSAPTQVDTSISTLLEKFPGDVDGVCRPTLEIMNATIAALAEKDSKEIPKVFSWGRSFGFEPDLTTYNALLGMAMRSEKPTDALAILAQMQKRGVQTDGTTWTVLLTSLFQGGFLDALDPDAQQKKITTFIDALCNKDLGLPGINSQSYALVMDRLFKQYSNGSGAVAVYSHMLSRGLQPTPHIYTILMQAYFQQKPQPDFVAISRLWRQVQDQGRKFMATVDTTFFDRMIEQYALHHRLVGIERMEEFVWRARTLGKRSGWPALEAAARAWADRQQWHKVKDLVEEVEREVTDQRLRPNRMGEKSFWDFILSTGVVDDEWFARLEGKLNRRGAGLQDASRTMDA
jgi:pentatricopeptide repeat protein